jgi:hypothetical protein
LTIKNILRADPVRLTTAGMCAGEVIGIAETLRTFENPFTPRWLRAQRKGQRSRAPEIR